MKRKPKLLNDKVREEKDKKYFNAPLNENEKPYWIPIVVKNKSYLLGFINAYNFISELNGLNFIDMEIALSSDRFNDVLIDGTRIKDITRKELKEKIRTLFFAPKRCEHPENAEGILDNDYLSLSCVNCGMFYSFKNEDEIPEDDFICLTCGNTLISYVHENDEYFDFDGESGDVDKILEEINKEKEN